MYKKHSPRNLVPPIMNGWLLPPEKKKGMVGNGWKWAARGKFHRLDAACKYMGPT
jgi:hypothetical protein